MHLISRSTSLKPCAFRSPTASPLHSKTPNLFTRSLDGARQCFSPNLNRRMIKELKPKNVFPWHLEQHKDFDPFVPEHLRVVFEPLYISLKYGNLEEWKRRGISPPSLLYKNLKELGSQHSISFAQALTSTKPDAPIHFFKDTFKDAPIWRVNGGCGDIIFIFGDNKAAKDQEDIEIFKYVVQDLKDTPRSEPPEFIHIGNVDNAAAVDSDIMQYQAKGTVIEIGLPSPSTRKIIFDYLWFNYGCDKDIFGHIDIGELSSLTQGFRSTAIHEVIRYANVLSLTRLVKMGFTKTLVENNPEAQILQKDFKDAIVVIQEQY